MNVAIARNNLRGRVNPVRGLSAYLAERSADIAIKRNGLLEIPVSQNFLLPRVTAIKEGMIRMTEDPQSLKDFPWQVLHEDAYGPKYDQEVGLKRTPAEDEERKFTFHYAPDMVEKFRAAGSPVDDYRSFFQALNELDLWSQDIALSFAELLDAANRRKDGRPKYPGSLVQKLVGGRRVVRVLRYQKPYAKMHIDRSIFTVHPWSSDKGLVFESPEGQKITVHETSLSTAAVFTGEKFAAATRGIYGYGAPHGVRDERHIQGVGAEDRYAIVCFVHPIADPEDAAWLLAHRHHIEEYEATLSV